MRFVSSISRNPRAQRGQTAVEYLGLLALIAVIIGVLLVTPIADPIRDGIRAAICRIAGGECTTSSGATADGRPPLDQCVRDSSKRGIAGDVKAFFIEIGGGVEALREERADGSVKITIKGNAKAGLEFSTPGADVSALGKEGGTGERSLEVSGNGEVAKSWVFENADDADDFVDDVKKKVIAIADPRPNFPGTDDDADIELPPSTETTVAGGVSVRAKGELGSGTGLEGNLGASVGATFNEKTGDKTVFFEVSGGGSASVGAGGDLFDIGGSGQAKTKIGITYDKDGNEKSLMVIGQLDVTATAGFEDVTEGADLEKMLKNAKKLTSSGGGGAGGRLIVDARLDLTNPENRDALRSFIDGRDPNTGEAVPRTDGAAGLFDRFKDEGVVNARAYALSTSETGAELDLGVFGISGEYTSEDAKLVDAFYRDLENGDFQRWEECVRGLA